MRRGSARHRTVQPRIIHHLDLPPAGAKARTLVEGERGGMVEGAGVQPEPIDLMRPGDLKRAVHQPAAGAAAAEFCGDAEHPDLALAGLGKIQFEQALVAAVIDQRVDFELRRMQVRRELGVAHPDARYPQPFLADAAVEIAKPVERRRLDPAQRPGRRGIGPRRGTRGHLQMRDDGGELAGGDVGIAVGRDHSTPLKAQ
jgi:hypothetical protein